MPPQTPDWDSEDRISFNKFLTETRAGSRLASALAVAIPGLLGCGDTNAILIRNGEVRGATAIIETLFSLAANVKETPVDANPYPPLDDDEAWNDGNKIETQLK